MGECFFWYRPTRVVPDQRLLNSCVCVRDCVCVEYLNMFCYKFTTESVSERIFENQFTFGEVMGKSLVSCVC